MKIYQGYGTTFEIQSPVPDTVKFIYHNSGSNVTVSGSFSEITSGWTQVTLTEAQTTTLATGYAFVYSIVDSIPYKVAEIEVVDINTVSKTHNQTVLEAIEAMIESRATKEQMSLSIAGRAIQYISLTELIKLRSYYKSEVEKETKANMISNSLNLGNTVLFRMG